MRMIREPACVGDVRDCSRARDQLRARELHPHRTRVLADGDPSVTAEYTSEVDGVHIELSRDGSQGHRLAKPGTRRCNRA
jgi:hypothetical protein